MERQIGSKKLVIESGDVAGQASGAVLVRYGDTVVLVTVVKAEVRDIDFLPLFVGYREELFAVGKIPGGRFYRREGRPSMKETLTMRMIDRPLRPLFPKDYRHEVQVSGVVLSAEVEECDPDVLTMVGASAALTLSPVPFGGPVGTVRVARIDGELVLNPSDEQTETSDFALVVSGTRERVVMIEGEANEVPKDEIADAIMYAQRELQPIIDMQEELALETGKPKELPPEETLDEELFDRVKSRAEGRIRNKIDLPTKPARRAAEDAILDALVDDLCDEDSETPADRSAVKACFERLLRQLTRERICQGKRVDGRGLDDVRPIECRVGLLPRTHGSAMFRRGETQALVTATLGTSTDEELVDGLYEEYGRKFMLQYKHPSFAVGEAKPDRGPSRREIGHGALAEKAVSKVLPEDSEFPYTLRLVAAILESNGSTSQASVCGATLCLMDAGVAIRRPVAGISIGLVAENGETHLLTDILGSEDHFGDMDFKVAGTQQGVTAMQVDVKNEGLTEEIIRGAFEKAREARLYILREMLKTLPEPRRGLSEHAPRLIQLKIDRDEIGKLIGPGGKMIRGLEEDTGARIEVEDDGTVTVSSPDSAKATAAKEIIEKMFEKPEVGRIYEGKVTGIKDFGAFVEILPGTDGLCHVSELADRYVENVEDEVKMGEVVRVKVLAVDDQGKIRLSRKALE
ncbi:MAG: polyribonucleotide nucleotidyltransferase [Planctomycetota bacterium]